MNIAILQPLGIEKEKINERMASLTGAGHTVTYFDTVPQSEKETIDRTKDAEIIMIVNHPLGANVINACPNLKMISVAFTGYDHVDTALCKQKNIVVSNCAGYSTNSVAELAFGLIIAVLRKIVPGDVATRIQGTRQGIIGNELHGKVLGIIGTGAIGMRVAEIGKAFGCKLIGYSRTRNPRAAEIGLTYLDLEKLLKESDIISVHAPLTAETKNLIDTREFALMKPTTIVIQTSRGGTINEPAFTDALNSGKIAGAGIDVFVQEPPIDSGNPLLRAKNTVLTPHVAFATKEALIRRADIAFININQWIAGNPQNRVA